MVSPLDAVSMTALLGRRIRPPLPAGLPSRHLSALPYAVGTINGLKVTSLLIPSGSLPSGCELCFAQAEREPAFTQPGNNQNNPVHNLACPFRGRTKIAIFPAPTNCPLSLSLHTGRSYYSDSKSAGLQTFGSLAALQVYNSAKESYICIPETKENAI